MSMLHHIGLQTQPVLIQGYQLFVLQQCQGSGGNGCHVTSYQQGRGHDAPYSEMGLFLVLCQAPAYLQHIHVIIMAFSGISRQIEILSDNGLDRLPAGRNIRTDTPRTSQRLCPRPGISPSADIDGNVPAANLTDGFHYFRITCLLVQCQLLSGPAIVYLDEVEAATVEEEIGIPLLMPIQPHTHSMRVFIPDRTTGIAAGIGINPGLEALGMNVISNDLQAIRESFWMNLQVALFVPSVEKTVINVDIRITRLLQPSGSHGIGLPLNQIFADMDAVGIPRTPAHYRRQKRSFLSLQARRGKRIKQTAKCAQPPLTKGFQHIRIS